MNAYLLDVHLTDEYVFIGPVPVLPRGNTVTNLIQVLGEPDRVLPMHYNNVLVNTLYLYDHLGIRFWAKGEQVSELQLVLETEARETFPIHSFTGQFEYKGYSLLPPVPGSLLASGELVGFEQDTDVLQYDRVVYIARTPQIKYTVLISNVTRNVKYVSIA